MVENGRTMREAIDAGTAYALEIPGWAAPYFPPAAESPQEVAECFADMVRRGWVWDGPVCGSEVRAIRYLPGSTIGCMFSEDAGTVRVPRVPISERPPCKCHPLTATPTEAR